ncbi:ENTH/VHS family protein isoform 1 [Dorcoceras hygrometricum]|uniref:ENTH/VHS family protein isoform 1 n=1 Tax=Dorcoceras hygrometricum TaxID=472368 RepID=A0A2Z7C6F6_9LAMI|nr:ENTH/VHS family protein isoform 1 [Dorcoceras hygrometricum]
MGSNFNPLILVEKLAKLNSSQQSIETLSHWCIFHMNKAKEVVETWDRQFHCAPRDQRLAFLYLANDILQNSRRKGVEFVVEFWKVLPGSLRDVIENGDEVGRNASLRLINIWEERKVFGSRGHILKEEIVKRQPDYDNRNWKHAEYKLKPAGADTLDKLVSGYQAVYNSQQDEDAILYKCRNAVSFVEKVDKNIERDNRSGNVNGSIADELRGQNATLRDCIEQLQGFEASRSDLVAFLREALQEQEYKLDQVRDQLQAAQTCTEQAGRICRQLLGSSGNGQVLPEQTGNRSSASQVPQNLVPGAREQTSTTTHAHQSSLVDKSSYVGDPKSAAAAVAAQLTALTSSAQVLSYAIASLEPGVIGNPPKDLPSDYPSEKRAKFENDHPSYVPQYPHAAALPFSHPGQLQHNLPVTSEELTSDEAPPLPPSSPPPLPPLPPPMQLYPQYMHTAMPMMNGPYGYNMSQQLPVTIPGYAPVGAPINGVSSFTMPTDSYQNYQTAEGSFPNQASSLPMAPMSRQ